MMLLAAKAFGQNGTTQYVYDNNGRLAAVVAPSGEVAFNQYDATGNLIGVTRQTNPTTVIVGFSPTSGFAGTRVTIRGYGFAPNVNQNSIKFNGVAAAATVASVTELIVVVPPERNGGESYKLLFASTDGFISRNDCDKRWRRNFRNKIVGTEN